MKLSDDAVGLGHGEFSLLAALWGSSSGRKVLEIMANKEWQFLADRTYPGTMTFQYFWIEDLWSWPFIHQRNYYNDPWNLWKIFAALKHNVCSVKQPDKDDSWRAIKCRILCLWNPKWGGRSGHAAGTLIKTTATWPSILSHCRRYSSVANRDDWVSKDGASEKAFNS